MAARSGWTITSQLADQFENTNAGQTVLGVRVYFITGNGNEGSVFVPDNLYTTKNVQERVRKRAQLIDEVGELSENFGQ